MPNNYKLFSDPVHGFISVPKGLMMALIQQPEVQRLRRIRQLGVGHLVFPGAEHTRFNHALGAMALMQDALAGIEGKGTPVSPTERTAALAAALCTTSATGRTPTPSNTTLSAIFTTSR